MFADAGRRQQLDTEFELRTAEQVAEALGHMKGALMKVGQMASYLDQGLPENVRAVLAELQHNAPPMSAELAAGVIREELGAPARRSVFAEWDPVPIAVGLDRPGPPGHHPRRPGGGGEGAVPGGGRGRGRRPRQRRA